MTDNVFDFTSEHWTAALLSAIPALLNIGIFIYLCWKVPDYRISKLLTLFVLALAIWQISDTMLRFCQTEKTAQIWFCALSIGALYTTQIGLHFVMHYTGRSALAEKKWFQFLLYGPSVVFYIIEIAYRDQQHFHHFNFWGQVFLIEHIDIWSVRYYWTAFTGLVTLYLLIRYIFKIKHQARLFKQAVIIGCGYLIPVLVGVATEIILPAFSCTVAIPITTTFLTCFSFATILALSKYKLFRVDESLKIPTLLEAYTEMLIVVSRDGRILYMNEYGADLIKKNPRQLKGVKLQDFFPEQDIVSKQIIEPVFRGEKLLNYPMKIITTTGEILTVNLSAKSFDDERSDAKALILAQNISAQIIAEQKLREREDELTEKTNELNTFFYRATHDLKGPSASITGLVTLAKKEKLDPVAGLFIEKIGKSANQLESILLELIRMIHIREAKITPVEIDLNKLICDIIQPLKEMQFAPEFQVFVDSQLNFYSDKGLMYSILYNLISNSAKYQKIPQPDTSYVRVEITGNAKAIQIVIRDNGIGIPKELHKEVFKIFFRGVEYSKGSGLGLYIVKNAVIKLGGTINLESDPETGTVFTIVLPNKIGEQVTEPIKLESVMA